MVWHKIGFISCFLLVALLRMAHMTLNPTDVTYNASGAVVVDCIQSMIIHFWMSRTQIGSFVEMSATYTYHVLCIFLPDMLTYWHTRCHIACRWYILSWRWWIIWISAIWLEPPLKERKQYNGTYWVGPKADLYQNKASSKVPKQHLISKPS